MQEETKKKRTVRRKKRTKAQEEKRIKLLNLILDKWMFVRYDFGTDEQYYFVKHRMLNENSTSKLEQILLSGYDYQDGIYHITDYEIELVLDDQTKREIVELRPKKYDLKMGRFAEDEIVESYEELKEKLVGAKYLTEDEFILYCQSEKKPPGIKEMRLELENYKK